MTYQEFKNKYNGKFIDYDKCYGNQCWDLGQQYFTECLGLPASVLSGCGLVSNMLYEPKISLLLQYFDEVSWNDMHSGDVVIWYYGHIALFDNYDGNNNYFSQNYPLNSNCHIQTIPEGNFRVFRIKSKPEPKYVGNPVERDANKDQIKVFTDKYYPTGRSTPEVKDNIVGYVKAGIYNILDKKVDSKYTWYKVEENLWFDFGKDWCEVLEKDNTEELKKEIDNLKNKITELNKENALLKTKIEEIKKIVGKE